MIEGDTIFWPPPRSRRFAALQRLIPALASLTAAAAFASWGYLAAGKSLGTLFAGPIGLTLLTPGIIVAARSEGEYLQGFLAVLAAIGTVWAITLSGTIRVTEWIDCMIVLTAFGLGLCGLGIAMKNLRINRSIVYALTVVLGVLWLTWPVWTATWLRGHDKQAIVNRLVSIHPLFVLNAAVSRSMPVPWPQFRIAYTIMTLGQDTPFTLPKNLGGCAWLHILIGFAAAALSTFFKPRRPSLATGASSP